MKTFLFWKLVILSFLISKKENRLAAWPHRHEKIGWGQGLLNRSIKLYRRMSLFTRWLNQTKAILAPKSKIGSLQSTKERSLEKLSTRLLQKMARTCFRNSYLEWKPSSTCHRLWRDNFWKVKTYMWTKAQQIKISNIVQKCPIRF